jgi:hypothetical protein
LLRKRGRFTTLLMSAVPFCRITRPAHRVVVVGSSIPCYVGATASGRARRASGDASSGVTDRG